MPPRSPENNYLELSFEHSGGNYSTLLGTNYARDYKSPRTASWSFQVESNSNSQILLSRDKSQISSLPDSVKIVLKDIATDIETDMKADSTCIFVFKGVRYFVVNSNLTGISNSKEIPTEHLIAQSIQMKLSIY